MSVMLISSSNVYEKYSVAGDSTETNSCDATHIA